MLAKKSRLVIMYYDLNISWGAGGIWGWVTKKNGLKGGPSKKIREKRGGHVKYFSKFNYSYLFGEVQS